jgi:AraC family transcriptional regulator
MARTLPCPADFSIFQTLQRSGVRLDRAAALGDGLAIAQWHRERRSGRQLMGYDMPGHHTLSLYLRGGDSCFRLGHSGLYGGAGKLCVLPARHYSRWSMDDDVSFMHLYISSERLGREAVMRFDREPRELELRDLTYIQDPRLAAACYSLFAAEQGGPAAKLAASSAAEAILHHLLAQNTGQSTRRPLGGLAPTVRRRVRDYVDAHLEQPLTLDELARVASLSTYHFAHMFRTSFGMPPHAWVLARRLARAQALLAAGTVDLAGAAQACGFGNASHLSRLFLRATGVTPGQYRQALRGGAAPVQTQVTERAGTSRP